MWSTHTFEVSYTKTRALYFRSIFPFRFTFVCYPLSPSLTQDTCKAHSAGLISIQYLNIQKLGIIFAIVYIFLCVYIIYTASSQYDVSPCIVLQLQSSHLHQGWANHFFMHVRLWLFGILPPTRHTTNGLN